MLEIISYFAEKADNAGSLFTNTVNNDSNVQPVGPTV